MNMQEEKVNTKSADLEKDQEKLCSICHNIIPKGEYFIESILDERIICSNCDEDLLIKGDIFYSIE